MKYYLTYFAIFLFTITGLQAQFSLWKKIGNNTFNANQELKLIDYQLVMFL